MISKSYKEIFKGFNSLYYRTDLNLALIAEIRLYLILRPNDASYLAILRTNN